MSKREPRYTPEEHARRGTEIYERVVRPKVEAEYRDKIVAIDIETEDFEIGENTLDACQKQFRRVPDAQIWCVRVGHNAMHRFGGRITAGRFISVD